MGLKQKLFGDRTSLGTSRHWTPGDGMESMHIEFRERELQHKLREAEKRVEKAEQQLEQLREDNAELKRKIVEYEKRAGSA